MSCNGKQIEVDALHISAHIGEFVRSSEGTPFRYEIDSKNCVTDSLYENTAESPSASYRIVRLEIIEQTLSEIIKNLLENPDKLDFPFNYRGNHMKVFLERSLEKTDDLPIIRTFFADETREWHYGWAPGSPPSPQPPDTIVQSGGSL